jgi:hypothetical protein
MKTQEMKKRPKRWEEKFQHQDNNNNNKMTQQPKNKEEVKWYYFFLFFFSFSVEVNVGDLELRFWMFWIN